MADTSESFTNRLLQALPPVESEKLGAQSEVLDMEIRHRVFEPDQPSEYVYFPLSGMISVHTRMSDGIAVELATIGREGMAGLEIFLGGEQTPASAFCQIPGRAARIGAEAFREVVRDSAPLTALLLRYTQATLTQVFQSAACNRIHSIEERCARWLLMTHDRVGRDEFRLTQEFLATMLGVRRATVTVAAGILQEAGLIRYRRGVVTIVKRESLEETACECYRVIRNDYERIMGQP